MDLNNKNTTILVVDDEPEILSLVSDYLADDEGYTVLTAANGREALDNVLSKRSVDLVLSDINMPVMKGFELLNEVRRLYPATKRVLITAYNVEDYIELALKHDVGNIFVKSTPFNFSELSTVLQSLLTEDIFGAQRYFQGTCKENTVMIRRGDRLDQDVTLITSVLPPQAVATKKLHIVLVELLTNAIFYGIRNEPPDNKETWNYDFELGDQEAILTTVAWDDEKYAISVVDNGGRLKKADVLYWLHRQIGKDDVGLPLGVEDSHGRGLFIARRYIDQLIINIRQNKKTEVILMNYIGKIYHGSKSLHINEI